MKMLLAIILLWSAGSARAQERVFSGPQVGEKLTAFKVVDLVGPNAGKEKDFISEFKTAPTVVVFLHGVERSMLPLVRVIDQYTAEKRDTVRTLYVFLSDDRVGSEQHLPVVQQSIRLQSPVTLSVDGIEGPGNYGLNKHCLLTILVAKESKVTANFALIQPGITDAPKIIAEIARAAGDSAPPTAAELEARRNPGQAGRPPMVADPKSVDLAQFDLNTTEGLRAAVKALVTEVQSLRREVKELRGQGSPGRQPGIAQPVPPRGGAPLPGAAPTDSKLLQLLRAFIQPTNDDAAVDRVLKEVNDYVKGDAALKKQAIDGWDRVLFLKYGTDYAQKSGKSFVEKLKS